MYDPENSDPVYRTDREALYGFMAKLVSQGTSDQLYHKVDGLVAVLNEMQIALLKENWGFRTIHDEIESAKELSPASE